MVWLENAMALAQTIRNVASVMAYYLIRPRGAMRKAENMLLRSACDISPCLCQTTRSFTEVDARQDSISSCIFLKDKRRIAIELRWRLSGVYAWIESARACLG